jgi:tripartite-type tricarboxylate transporter receptor subunit TctC
MGTERYTITALRAVVAALAAAAVALLAPGGASSQTRTLRIVVPFAPAGGTDTLARLVANHITRVHGTTVVVENRPGAGTVIATEAVARAAPDGNTVLIVGNSFVINPNMKKLNYDPLTSFEPICHLTRSPNIVAVHAASPHRTLANLIDAS